MKEKPNQFIITKEEWEKEVKQLDKIRNDIEDELSNYDNIELFCRIAFQSSFYVNGQRILNKFISDIPAIHFLIGLSLKKSNDIETSPTLKNVEDIYTLVDSYFNKFVFINHFNPNEPIEEFSDIIRQARVQNMINQQNPERYPFQSEELVLATFSGLNPFFETNFGFNASDAFYFGSYLIDLCQNNMSKRITYVQTKYPQYEGNEIEILNETFNSSNYLFEIPVDSIFEEEKDKKSKFLRYLELFTCNFGEGNPNYNSPIDDNLIFQKPIIGYNGKYYCPVAQLLIEKLPDILELLLTEEKSNETKIWQRYTKTKSEFTEKKVSEYLKRVFPSSLVYNNAFYRIDDKRVEVDHLVPYCNVILIIEDKSGSFTDPAKRGGIKRIEHDLKRLIGEAHEQGTQTKNFIKSIQKVKFENEYGKSLFEISYNSSTTQFVLINVTLEPLFSFAAKLGDLRKLDIIKNNDYPWSVNLFELDLITQYLKIPALFLHYVQRRIDVIEKNRLMAFDDLSFLGLYLRHGNFEMITPEDEKFTGILLEPEFLEEFDQHYLFGQPPPKLEIEPETLELISSLERLNQNNYTNITNVFLDLNHKSRQFIFSKIRKMKFDTSLDGKNRYFSYYKSDKNVGFSFLVDINREDLQDNLYSYSLLSKYNCKAKIWIGIGIDILDKSFFAHELLYFDFPWQFDPDVQSALQIAIDNKLIKKFELRENT